MKNKPMNNEDTISRSEALTILHKNPVGTWRGVPVYSDEIKAAILGIEGLPSAPPQVPQGHWIAPTELDGHWVAECSYCHKIRTIDNYCSACGAKMRGVDDGQPTE